MKGGGGDLLVLTVLVTFAVAGFLFFAESQYKKGQIDALNGVVNYHLEKQKDGSTEWVYISKDKK